MNCRIIINADDFGMSPPVNEAVFNAATDGVLTSATIMANMPTFEEAVAIAKATPKLGVGIHLNLFRGRPLADPANVPTIITAQGRLLRSYGELYKRWFLGKLSLEDIELEWSTQIQRVIASGLTPTHLDSEKHAHIFFRPAWDIIIRLARRHAIKAIRAIDEAPQRWTKIRATSLKRRLIAASLSHKGRVFRVLARAQGIMTADAFFGVARTGSLDAHILRTYIKQAPPGVVEVMSHPATTTNATELIGEQSWVDAMRVDEYQALIDPQVRDALEQRGIELIHYGNIASSAPIRTLRRRPPL